MKPTPYEDINKILEFVSHHISKIFGKKLIGIYLFGSLTYGDFNTESSDIDLEVILKDTISNIELDLIEKIHDQIKLKHLKWAKRVEISYTPISMLSDVLPPSQPRPYFGEGIFYPAANYGNEWIINNYLLYQYGFPLIGPDFKTLIASIDIEQVKQAAAKDLFTEWEPKLNDSTWLNNSHYQSYLVLNLCRILYTTPSSSIGSKKVSASWTKNYFPQWKKLIQTAEDWRYGLEMNRKQETINFLKFSLKEVKSIR
jgi:predicted nucleotidyltransferase